MIDLQDELFKDLKIELSDELHSDKDEKILSVKIKNAIREVMQQRNYQKGHDKAFIEADMQQFYPVIHNLVIYDWNKIGAEGEKSHGENGISRGYADRNTYLSSVIPFATVI